MNPVSELEPITVDERGFLRCRIWRIGNVAPHDPGYIQVVPIGKDGVALSERGADSMFPPGSWVRPKVKRKPLIAFRVNGLPVPGGSKTSFAFIGRDDKPHSRVVDAAGKKNKDWKRWVAMVASDHAPKELLSVPLRVEMRFLLLRPKGHYGTGKNAGTIKRSALLHPTVKPDVLKLARSTEDAMTGVIWRDDSATVDLVLSKRYVSKDPGVEIEITALNDD